MNKAKKKDGITIWTVLSCLGFAAGGYVFIALALVVGHALFY